MKQLVTAFVKFICNLKKFKIFKLQINFINAVTNCLISYMLLNSLFELSFD